MVMRWIVRFGEYILGRRPEDPWITPKILILFWLTDFLVLKTLRISKLDWVFGLWSCNTEIRRRSLWFVSGKDLLTSFGIASNWGFVGRIVAGGRGRGNMKLRYLYITYFYLPPDPHFLDSIICLDN